MREAQKQLEEKREELEEIEKAFDLEREHFIKRFSEQEHQIRAFNKSAKYQDDYLKNNKVFVDKVEGLEHEKYLLSQEVE